MEITIKTTGANEVRKALASIGRQAPFALATGLNSLANETQKTIQDSLESRFTLRRADFVRRSIYRDRATDFATKTRPQAIVRINPARDILARHELGGRKTALSGRNLAIPLPAVQPNPKAVIPKALRPSGLQGKEHTRKITTAAGTFLVRDRPGRGKGRLIGWRTEFLYKLRRDVPLRPRLGFHDTAKRVIDASWDRHIMAGIEKALRTAR